MDFAHDNAAELEDTSPQLDWQSLRRPALLLHGRGAWKDTRAATKDKRCFINRLPFEILLDIFELAHAASCVPVPPSASGLRWSEPLREASDSRAKALAAALRFTLGLAEVCKDWVEPARHLAFRHVVVHHVLGLLKLKRVLENDDSLSLAPYIHSFDLLLPATVESATFTEALGRALSDDRSARHRGWQSTGSRPLASEDGLEEDYDAGGILATLFFAAENLTKLTLRMVKMERGFRSWGGSIETSTYVGLLEEPILRALTSLPALTHLTLRFTVDFEQLATILFSTPNLESLTVDSLDNLSTSIRVVPAAPNHATRLRLLELGNSRLAQESSLSAQQLAWLLDPSATANTLRKIHVSLFSVDVSTSRRKWVGGSRVRGGGFGGGGGGEPASPFASASFADALARCSKLETLVLQELSFNGAKHPSLAQPPHNGSLDHALSQLTSLHTLTLPWKYTGSSLLASIAPLQDLETLDFGGVAVHTSSDAFAAALEGGDIPALKTLGFTGAYSDRATPLVGGGWATSVVGAEGWTEAGSRRVSDVAETRQIEILYGGVVIGSLV
ncbi:hypothetical protein JCM6882_006911 [Rhodosporidiobolus microsporus]